MTDPDELMHWLDNLKPLPPRLDNNTSITFWAFGPKNTTYEIKVPTLERRTKWDLVYVRRCSLRLDLWIILQSIWITLRGGWEEKGNRTSGERS